MSAKEIYDELGGVWGKDCPKYKTIKTWAREFRRTSTNTCREPGSGHQKCYHQQKRRRCLRHGDESRMSDSYADSGRIRP